jgi:hypothetical protein
MRIVIARTTLSVITNIALLKPASMINTNKINMTSHLLYLIILLIHILHFNYMSTAITSLILRDRHSPTTIARFKTPDNRST